jgi:hypothetical protein
VIGPSAILYGLAEVSIAKKDKVLKAEFPHFWGHIEKFAKGKTEYSERALKELFGSKSSKIVSDLVNIGLLEEKKKPNGTTYHIPFLYRHGLELTQGKVD